MTSKTPDKAEGWVGVVGTTMSLERVLATSRPWWCLPRSASIGALVAMYCTSSASKKRQGFFGLYKLTGFEDERNAECRHYGSTARIFGYPAFAWLQLTKQLDEPLTWAKMTTDPILSRAQCVQRKFQGTFFKLQAKELGRILAIAKGAGKA